MAKNICYKRNFLSSVIARIDFVSPIEEIQERLPPEISRLAMSNFPISVPTTSVAQNYQISAAGIKEQHTQIKQWEFHGRQRDKVLTITPHMILVNYTRYSTYEALKSEYIEFVAAFLSHYSDQQGSRSGLRYINEINLDSADPLNWKGYLDPRLLSVLDFYENPSHIGRSFSNLELNFGDFNLRFQFGIFNPDYPAPIKKKSFILDFDAFQQGPQGFPELAANFDRFHDQIQQMFERSIQSEMRKILDD